MGGGERRASGRGGARRRWRQPPLVSSSHRHIDALGSSRRATLGRGTAAHNGHNKSTKMMRRASRSAISGGTRVFLQRR